MNTRTLLKSWMWWAFVIGRLLVPVLTIVPLPSVYAQAPRTVTTGAGGTERAAALPLEARFAVSRLLGGEQAAYRARRGADGALVFTNPEQGVSARFDEAGFVLRTGMDANLRWTFAGLGYGASLRAPEDARPKAWHNRVEYRRRASTEWYVNGPLGVEQGFTLRVPPSPHTAGPLTVALRIADAETAAPLDVRLDGDGRGMTLTAAHAAALRYRGLIAVDARGRDLRAWMETEGQRVLLRVDDKDAVYPLIIDPFIERAKLSASDGVGGDLFGWAAAMDGDVVVVTSSPTSSNLPPATIPQVGEAYVFVKPAGGWSAMTETARLSASGEVKSDAFGQSVAISGDTVVVGAPSARIGSAFNRGAAYVFVKPAGGWATMTETAKLTTSDPIIQFGSAVAISGDTVVAAAPNTSRGGAAYVFIKPSGGWSAVSAAAKLTASNGTAVNSFGFSVAATGDTVVVGAVNDDVGANTNQGSAYVFVKPAGGWASTTETAKLTASDGAIRDRFGICAAISGDTVVVGVSSHTVGANVGQGSAYVFVRPAGGWATMTETAELTASDGARSDGFGRSVAIRGDTVVVGALLNSYGTDFHQGSAYVFLKPAGGWTTMTQTGKIIGSDGALGSTFGQSVATRGDVVVVGTNFGSGNQKSAYVFELDDIPPTIGCPANITVNSASGLCSATVTTGAATATDNFGPISISSARSDGQPISAPYPAGTTTITWTATDAAGNKASCLQTITVVDNVPPAITCPADVSVSNEPGLCNARVDAGAPAATDNCGPLSVSGMRSDGQPLIATYPVGVTTIVWKATDASGNASTCTQRITVKDAQPPSVTVPAPITVEFVSDAGAPVTFSASTSDNCPGATVTCSRASGSLFPIGSTLVSCVASDLAGNTTTRTFTVIVLGPRGVKQDVLAELQALRATVNDKQNGKALDDAIDHLKDSLDPGLWIDQTHLQPKSGEKAFQGEKDCVVKLTDVMKDNGSGAISDAALQDFIKRIVAADRLLATVAINDLAASGGTHGSDYRAAVDDRDAGDRDASLGKDESAIEHYRDSWSHAQGSHP